MNRPRVRAVEQQTSRSLTGGHIRQQPSCHVSKPDQSSADELVSDANSKCSYILKQEMLILYLPPEIISLILIRLSIKTLSILKCVGRFFSNFIASPDFITVHLKFSSEDVSLSSYRVIVDSYSELKQTSIQSLWCVPLPNLVNLDYPKRELRKSVRLEGSCNGLVFIIVNQKHWFLWNPTIRKHKKLPNIGRQENPCHLDVGKKRCLRPQYGFGFDVSNDDYKVVALFAFTCADSRSKGDVCYVVNVYSLKRGSWMRIPDFTGEEFDRTFGKFASGRLHWITVSGDIVSFDVEREVFGTMEQPNYEEGYYNALLSVLGGSISVCCDYDSHVDVWVMKEYGINESWTKMFTLTDYVDFGFAQAYSILPNGEVLIDDGTFVFYNPKDNSCRYTGISLYHDPVIYVESFVTPFCN